jgi:uncharacterized membrane protein YgdD (TMEM256/DUF423 family)
MRDLMSHPPRHPASRLLGAFGGVLAAASVGLAAYAAHGVDGEASARLSLAAAFAFGHGVALAALARNAHRRTGALALLALLVGVLLFSGSLVAGVLWGAATTFAPAGGMLLIAGWLLFALHSLRR